MFSDERTEEELAVSRDQTHQSREQSVLTEDAVGTEALSREESIPLKKTTDEILEEPGFEFQAVSFYYFCLSMNIFEIPKCLLFSVQFLARY